MEENKTQRVYKIIMLVVLTAVITALITTIAIYKLGGVGVGNIEKSTVQGNNSNISYTLSNFRNIIDKYYLGEVDDKALLEGAIKGYIAGLDDPYSEYFTKEELEDYKEDTMGNFTGIGIYMVKNTEKNAIQVLAPIKGTPAEEAGILPGDIIYKINDEVYTGDQMTEASNKIKGETGSKVKLQIIREDKTIDLEVERKNIKVNHVESKIIDNTIGYLKLSTFDEGCAAEFKEKLEELKKQNITSLIVDLRNNGGGIVDEALDIANLLTEKDATLLITTDKNGKEEVKKAKSGKAINVPVMVLTNGNSASSSEILAGALKDNNAAKIVGTKTYGKGVIQELLTLSDGSGLKITTNEYYTPNKNKINKVGIEPDEKIELPEEYKNKLTIPEDQDTQLQKAIELLKK